DVEAPTDGPLQAVDRRLLRLEAANVGADAGSEEDAARRLDRWGGHRRRGRRRGDGLVVAAAAAPEGEGSGAGDAEHAGDRYGDPGAGREEAPEPGCCRRHDSTGLHGDNGPLEGTSLALDV